MHMYTSIHVLYMQNNSTCIYMYMYNVCRHVQKTIVHVQVYIHVLVCEHVKQLFTAAKPSLSSNPAH